MQLSQCLFYRGKQGVNRKLFKRRCLIWIELKVFIQAFTHLLHGRASLPLPSALWGAWVQAHLGAHQTWWHPPLLGHSDSHCGFDLVGVSLVRSSLKDVASTLSSVEQSKRDKHSAICKFHVFDLIPLDFSPFGSLNLVVEELLSCIC